MPVGTSPSTKLLDAINVAVTAVTGIQAVYQGKERFSETQNLENQTRALTPESQGYFVFWINTLDQGNFTTVGDVLITGYLQIYVPTNNTSDMNIAYDLAANVNKVLANEDTYSSIGVRPKKIQYTQDINDDEEDGVVKFLFALNYQLPITCNT